LSGQELDVTASDLLEPGVRELASFASEDLRDLANRLGLSYSDVGSYAESKAEHFPRALVRDAIQSAIDNRQSGRLERLARIRIFFETAMLWHVSEDQAACGDLLSALAAIHSKMEALAADWDVNSSVASALWELDGKFHREICQASGFKYLATIVDDVTKECRKVGMPRTAEEVSQTLREHSRIIAAIQNANRDAAFEAVSEHVWNACQRWNAKDEQVDDLILSEILLGSHPVFEASEQAFFRNLDHLLANYCGKWVAYHGAELIASGNSQGSVYKEVQRRGLSFNQYTIRLVSAQLKEDAVCEID
jgi:hypothetical protein